LEKKIVNPSKKNIMSPSPEKKPFEANISELMNIIINSFYSNKDVFLRELISNSSDAIDKQRHFDLQKSIVDKEYQIKINPFSYEKCLVIEDNGVGMNEEEIVNNLSTIASSGTKEFVKSLSTKSDQIGQFGVGFYSAFLVADQVDVYTRKEGEDLYKWSSDANQFYTIEKVDASEDFPTHGTRIVLHLKEDCLTYSEEQTIRRIVSQHSSFILYPIHLHIEKTIEVEEPEEEIVEEEEGETKDEVVVEEVDVEDGESKKPEEEPAKKPKKTEKVREWEKVNGDRPIWYNSSSDVSDESYESLYKTLSKDYEKPLYWRHFQTEGNYEFRGILYIPSKVPFDMLGDRNRDKRNIKLYVKKVLVLNELEKEMLPDWMNFVVGVIDSADLPLNVSREMLQQNKIVKAMKTQLKKQVMNMMNDLFANEEKYRQFYQSFHRHIKLGIHEGDETLMSFLKIKNNKNDQLISLEQYVDEHLHDEQQKSIYYVTGTEPSDNLFGKLYTQKGYCVLYFDEPIDEFMLQRASKFKEYELVNICKDHTTPWQTEASSPEESEAIKSFMEWTKTTINDSNVDSVKPSTKLVEETDVPIYVLSSKWGWTGNMEKIMAAQPLGDNKQMSFMKGKRVVELNLAHPIVKNLRSTFETDETKAKSDLKILYQCGLLAAGYPVENTVSFVNDIYSSLGTTVAGNPTEAV
jgi:molecular chaperone HtpG